MENERWLQGFWPWLLVIVLGTLAVVLFLYLFRKCIQGPYYTKKNRIDGKVVIITGCNTGIGKETALELARRGARIYMACRDATRCETARLEIIEMRAFAESFKAEEQRLDILINNAGIMATPRKLTVDGYEQQFGVNHLGHFLLTNLLLDHLKAAAPSRIVVVSSLAYVFGRINRNDLNSERSYSSFFGAYSQSKLANILFTRKLSEILKDSGVTVNCCHPGIVRTEIVRNIKFPGFQTFFKLVNFFIKSTRAGAQTQLFLALDPTLAKTSGYYYDLSMRIPLLPWARSKSTADWLWQQSAQMVGLTSDENVLKTVVVAN